MYSGGCGGGDMCTGGVTGCVRGVGGEGVGVMRCVLVGAQLVRVRGGWGVQVCEYVCSFYVLQLSKGLIVVYYSP